MADPYGGGVPAPKPKKKKPRFEYGAKQQVKGGVEQRARQRLGRTGPVKGVNAKDGITGREARKIKRVAIREGKLKPRTKKPGQNRTRTPVRDPYARELNAMDQLQFGPQLQELDFERRRNEQHTGNLTNWYGQHVQDVQKAQAQHQAFQAGLVAGQNQMVTGAAQTDTAQNNQLLAQAQQSAAQRGAVVDPALAQTLQQGVAARQATGIAGSNALAQQGSAQAAYMGNQVVRSSEQGIQARQDMQERSRALDSVARELARERGAARVKNKTDLQEMYWKRRLEEAVFGLDQAEFAADLADQQADNRRQAKNDRSLRRDRVLDNRRQERAERRQERNTQSLIEDRREDNARQRRKDLADDGKVNGSNFSPTQVRSGRKTLRNLISRGRSGQDLPPSTDPLLARAAAQIIKNGGVDPDLARKVKRNYGFMPKMRRGIKRPPNAPGANGQDRPT